MGYAATIGFFDGVHKGHRFLLGELHRVAAEEGLQSAVITFDEHPETVLGRNLKTSLQPSTEEREDKPLLTTPEERAALLKETGIDEIFLFRFDVIRQMTAAEFMAVLHERCGVEVLLMGYDHRFGSDRLTNIADYAALGQSVGIAVVPVAEAPGGTVSSSKIRKALLAGDITAANAMLGYAYTLSGTVVHGNGLGHTIGFPTANIQPAACKLIPAAGVYAAEGALVNIGTNPTVGNDHVTIEAYFPDYHGADLYGQTVSLRLLRRIREERKFASLDELKNQIQSDLESIKQTI